MSAVFPIGQPVRYAGSTTLLGHVWQPPDGDGMVLVRHAVTRAVLPLAAAHLVAMPANIEEPEECQPGEEGVRDLAALKARLARLTLALERLACYDQLPRGTPLEMRHFARLDSPGPAITARLALDTSHPLD